MNNIITLKDFLAEKEIVFTQEQINECLEYLNSNDDQILEAWYNTILDFAALVPGIGSVAEGINLVSYAKQGEYLLAGLCSIGLIPFFGQYIGAGGTLLVKSLRSGGKLGKGLLKPLLNGIAKFFPKISKFFKSSKFATKFKGIRPYVDKMLGALKAFVKSGGKTITKLAKSPKAFRAVKKEARNLKQGIKIVKLGIGSVSSPSKSYSMPTGGPGSTELAQIPVPQDAYMNYQGTPLKNIRPYTDMEISHSEMSDDWSKYI